MSFEAQYQTEFAPIAEKHPIGSEVFANGKVYKVVDYEITGNKRGLVGVDREGNEKALYVFEPVLNKVCGRCGGSGRYSWNQKHGSVCYGCSGVGKQVLAPNGFPQKVKTVCEVDLPKFGFKVGDELRGEFCGFSKTGGTPKYAAVNKRTNVGNIIMYSTIKKHFKVG